MFLFIMAKSQCLEDVEVMEAMQYGNLWGNFRLDIIAIVFVMG